MDEPSITTSADIIKFRGRMQVSANSEVKAFDFNIDDARKLHDLFKQWRGQVISSSINVEEKIEDIISSLLFKDNSEGYSLFQTTILSREFFSFIQKRKVMEDLLKNIEPFKLKDYSQLIDKIHYIINFRNKFAHGRVNLEGVNADKLVLDFFKNEIRKEQITENTINEFTMRCKECFKELDSIFVELRNSRKKLKDSFS